MSNLNTITPSDKQFILIFTGWKKIIEALSFKSKGINYADVVATMSDEKLLSSLPEPNVENLN